MKRNWCTMTCSEKLRKGMASNGFGAFEVSVSAVIIAVVLAILAVCTGIGDKTANARTSDEGETWNWEVMSEREVVEIPDEEIPIW